MMFQISMEGEVSELETLDSELVMSFYDQYHTEDLSKVSFSLLMWTSFIGQFVHTVEGVNRWIGVLLI